MKGKWVCACLIGGLCLLPIRMSVPFNNHDGHVNVSRREQGLDLGLTLELAEKGIMKGVPVRLGDMYRDDMIDGWGEAGETRQKDGSYFAAFPSRYMYIGYNKAGVFELRSEHPDVQKLSPAMVLAKLGNPAEIRKTKRETMYIYRVGKHELNILFDQETDRALYQAVYSSAIRERGEYFLEIEGDSLALTESDRNGMNKGRKEMEAFVQRFPLMLSANGPNRKQVALTFDDGPDQTVTAEILDTLQQYDVQGNFFFLGSQAAAYPQTVQKAYYDGHLIASLSYDFLNLTTLTEEQVRLQIEKAAHEIESIIGESPAIFRPPNGELNNQIIRILSDKDWHTVLWSIDTLDWSVHTADEIAGNVKHYVRNGDIILMHSHAEQKKTAEALPKILDFLLEDGYEVVRIDEMLGVDAYED